MFRLDRISILACSEAHTFQIESNSDAPIALPETSTTLGLLFQFTSRGALPDLKPISFDVLEALAAAAEKYRVNPAMDACRYYMRFV